MGYYVGLDVSLKSTHICVLDGDRRVVWRGVSDTQIAMLAEHLARWGKQIVLVGLETGSLTPWLYHGLSDLGLPMVCMDARRASDALKARAEKTDKADARALAEMLASGWYSGEPSTESAIGGAGSTGSGQAPALRPGPWPAAALRDQDIPAGRRQVFR
jgi:transposase